MKIGQKLETARSGDNGTAVTDGEMDINPTRKVKTVDARKLLSPEVMEHVLTGDLDDLFRLKGGMHSQFGFDKFIDGRASVGKPYGIDNVTSFEPRNDGTNIQVQELPNGVRRAQLPRDAWATKKAFENASIKFENGERIKGVKTLLPKSFTADDVVTDIDQTVAQ